MSDAQINEDTFDGGDEGSPVLNELRQQLRESKKREADTLKQLEEYAQRDAQARQAQAKQFMDAAGYPTLTPDIVMERIEGEVTADSVVAALKDIGLEPQAGVSEESEPVPTPQAPQVSASEMGQRVAEAATGGGVADLDARLAASDGNPAEIERIMAEHGLLQSHSG